MHTLILNSATAGRLVSKGQARQPCLEVPLIGCAFPPRKEHALEAGAVDYLVKPVRQDDLAEALRRFGRPVKHVLIVDDGLSWSNWFSRPSRPIAPQLVFVDYAGCEALLGLGVDLYRSTAGTWQRQRLTTPDAPITGLLPLASQTLVALTDRLVVSVTESEWVPVETAVNGHPLAALGQSGDQIVVVTSDGQIWQGRHESN